MIAQDGMHIEGKVKEVELRWLHNMSSMMDSVVEIGVWFGRNTYGICSSGCPHVYSIDPFPKEGDICPGHFISTETGRVPFVYRGTDDLQYEKYMENVGHFTNLITLRMSSEEAAKSPLVPDEFDMVYIDANHYFEFVMLDLELWAPRARKVIAGHDYNFPGVSEAVTKYFARDGITLGPGAIWHVLVDNDNTSV